MASARTVQPSPFLTLTEMDKYTVDLDKVLNDFEYSELTEQSADSHPPYPSPSAESRSHIGPAKHSINNVFSSLDEYLNTEINGGPKQNNDVYKFSATPKLTGGFVAKGAQIKDKADEYVNSVNNLDFEKVNGESDVRNIVKNAFVEENSEVFDREIDLNRNGSEIGSGDEMNIKTVENLEVKAQNLLEISQDFVRCPKPAEIVEQEVESVAELVEVAEPQQENESNVETKELPKVFKEPEIVEELNGQAELVIEEEQIELKKEENELKIDECKNERQEKEDTAIVEEQKNEDKTEENKALEDQKLEIVEEQKLEVVKEEKLEVVKEQKLEVVEEQKLKVALVVEEHGNKVETEEEKKDVTTAVPLTVASDVVAPVKEKIMQPLEIEKPKREVKPVKEVNSKQEETKAVTPALGFNVPLEFDDEDLQQYLDKLEVTEAESQAKETTETLEVKLNNEVADVTADRPASLGLHEKREINLIGNPGSTPYNNLYVSKEIPMTKPPYESESSASVSPTFSEASTDSVHSTDSTDVENDTVKAREDPDEPPTLPPRPPMRIEPMPDKPEEEMIQVEEDIYVDLDKLNEESNLESSEGEGQQSADIWLGKRAPVWIPDADALNCLHCDMKFTVIKRRHHCRACGLVLCSKCCSMRHKLEYLDMEARVCTKCHEILSRDSNSSSGSEVSNSPWRQAGQPNPNNPMEYCSVVPPLQQVSSSGDNPPSVMVPVGVLKRTGSNKTKHNKSVMFCDGIRPGSDLTNLDNDFNYSDKVAPTAAAVTSSSSSSSSSTGSSSSSVRKHPILPKANRNIPAVDPNTKSFIQENENCLPPTVTTFKSDISYTECANNANVVEMLKNETLTFALQRNLHVHVRLITMDCCINKQAWCFSTEGLITAGQDEIVILLEYVDNEKLVPKDIFYHLNNIYNDAVKGTTVTELGLSIHPTTNFLDSKNHAGFIYIRPTFQCLQNVIVPKESYLVGVLVHRWETPWAKNFPLRLVLRLGAEYRYYPSPLISTRHRDSVFVEIGQTIINLLADFRNFTYTLPNIRGLTIHMEEKNTTVTIPINRYDQVMKSISNSSEHILAFGGNFSSDADSHLVCIQDVNGSNENKYTTHAINIQNKPRKVTGASFIVFNGALKSSSGLTAKSSIVEDGLMVQIPPEHMIQVRECLRNMKNHTIQCGCVNAASDETVSIVWGDKDTNFNIGVKSSVDDTPLSGVPSIRVHNGKDFPCNSGERLIRWTEVFLLQSGEENARSQDGIDVSKIAESISKATCQALVKYLNLLATNNFYKIGIRTNLHADNVSYSAGSNGIKLPPIYMKSLDNELIPVLHRITSNNLGDGAIVLELVYRILNV